MARKSRLSVHGKGFPGKIVDWHLRHGKSCGENSRWEIRDGAGTRGPRWDPVAGMVRDERTCGGDWYAGTRVRRYVGTRVRGEAPRRRDWYAGPPHSEGAVVRGLAAREAMGCFRFGDWAGLRYALSLRKGALAASAEGLAHVAAAWIAPRRAKGARQAGRFVSQFARRSASPARCDVQRKARSRDKARRRVG